MRLLILLVCTLLCVSCSQSDPNTLKVGVIAGPEADLVQTAKDVAAEQFALTVKLVTFSDYSMPNTALSEGSIDANLFQHQPYLEQSMQAHRYRLVSSGKTFIYPMALYSKRHTDLSVLPDKALVAIPNDPSNGARALLLLQKAGLLSLKDGGTAQSSPLDIVENVKQLKIKTLDAAQLPRILEDVDLAVINTNYAIPAGLLPARDGLFQEGVDSLYANILVVRLQDQDDPRFQYLLEALHSPQVLTKARELFKNQAIPAW